MSSDPLARSDIWAGAPNEAEYDAVYAAVTATERGRWFLSEYASRNRHADTHALVGAIARVEAAIHGDRTAQSPDTAAIGAERIETPDVSGAAERIQDIAFALRERAVDPALCDALDAAAREICDACARGNGAEPTSVAPMTHGNGFAPADKAEAEAEAESDPLLQGGLFTMDVRESERLAQAITALAQPVIFPAEMPGTASEPQSGASSKILSPDYEAAFPESAPEPATAQRPDDRPRWYIEPPDFAFHTADRESERPRAASTRENGKAHALLPQAPLLPGPRDDPADLFEPPLATAVTPSPAMRAVPRPAPPDPLAAMRALSEEEVIALFS